MNKTSTGGTEQITPAVHLEFIQNQAALPDKPSLEDIESYHRALFMHHHARDLERFRQEAILHEERLGFLAERLRETQSRLQKLDPFVPVQHEGGPDVKPSLPWNSWDRAMFVGALLATACLLVFGVLNISFNLLESGLTTFLENPVRAYFWAALLPVGAFGVKVGWDLMTVAKWRTVYLWVCLGLGMAGVLVWVGTYSTVYPTLSKSISDHLETLSVFDDTGGGRSHLAGVGARGVDMAMVFAQGVAEIFLSAVLGIYMTLIYSRHRPVRLAADPVFNELERQRVGLQRELGEERIALAAARGQEIQLENQLIALAAFAKSIYQKETARRQDQTHQREAVLDQISQQVRTQLETIRSAASQNGSTTLSLTR